jgi:glycerol-3-phosphate acyltransferase PlsX
MRIILDAMGGDNAPTEIVKGAVQAAKEYNCSITIVGDRGSIESILESEGVEKGRFEIVHTTEVITNNEVPTEAIRKKKDSSLVVGLELLKDGKGDAFISAGSTGALLAGGIFIVKRIDGIDRPALSPVVPGKNNHFLLLDVGANAECKPQYLLQFAIMGNIYVKKVLHRENPSVAVVNIGSEEEKGSRFVKECIELIKTSNLNFKGSIEGREIPDGNIDVVVTDGFTGNVILKVFEGVSGTIFDILKQEIMATIKTKIGGLLLKPVFRKFKKQFDNTEHGGAVLLGLNAPVIKAHGSSNAKAVKNAIRQAINCIEGGVVESIKDEMAKMNSNKAQ